MPSTTRTLTSIMGNSQRLDGGAMFGNAPKALWTRWIDVDDDNRIPLCCRALLVEEPSGERVLIETGIGAFFEPKMRDRFGVVEPQHVLLESLGEHGLTHEDIDVVILSHLHFDHAGGLLAAYQADKAPELLFPNARFVVGQEGFERANKPHFRDRASFIADLPSLLESTGRLELVPRGGRTDALGSDDELHWSDGHTPGLMLAELAMPGGPVVFGGDLIPGAPWVHLPITMGYDRYAELLIDEKQKLLEDLVGRNGRLFFTHDHGVAMARVARDERGRFTAQEVMTTLTRLSH